MKNSVFIFLVGLSAYFQTATTDMETVWLKDVTTRFQTDKRTHNDPDLPDQLSFHLQRKSHALTLNLKRNFQIDPNADIYVVRKLTDGRFHLEKTRNLEKEDVAYYQDSENGAFVTAKCIKKSNGQRDVLINGNIRIGDRSYDLRPSETDVTSRNFLENTGLLGKRYILQDQANTQREMSVENKDETHVNETKIKEKLTDLLQRIPHGKDKQKHFLRPDVESSTRNVAGLHNKRTTGDNSYRGTNTKDDTICQLKKDYYVEVVVLIDSGVWDLFLTMAKSSDISKLATKTKKRIRQYYSHIMNGVDLLYKGIEDSSISISVSIRAFAIFQWEAHFPHNQSRVKIHNGQKMIDGSKYLNDLAFWDIFIGSKLLSAYDQIILFTKHVLYDNSFDNTRDAGISLKGYVCEIGGRIQIVRSMDYFLTMSTAAHELGHSLGASHDGELDAIACKAEDFYIMSSTTPIFDPTEAYSRNPWLFSDCSVEAFKRTLANKTCVTSKGVYSQDELDEWNKFMKKLPGEKYTLNEQCHLINGPKSASCGVYLDVYPLVHDLSVVTMWRRVDVLRSMQFPQEIHEESAWNDLSVHVLYGSKNGQMRGYIFKCSYKNQVWTKYVVQRRILCFKRFKIGLNRIVPLSAKYELGQVIGPLSRMIGY